MTEKTYKQYIFDFYGTLVDIETDETDPVLWQTMAELYAAFGADYTSEELEARYHQLIEQAEAELKTATGYQYPEVDLEIIFAQILLNAPKTHAVKTSIPHLGTWTKTLAQIFRVLSRKRLQPYPNTLAVLKKLKEQGARVILLSNAQAVFTQAELETTGVLPYLDEVYLSSDYQMKKPQPDFLQLVLDKNHISAEETVMVGNDFDTDMTIAQVCGIDGVLVNTFPYSQKELAEHHHLQAHVIHDLSELLED